jgi:hypothetical protein
MHFLRGAEVACEREGWSAQRPLDRSRKGEKRGRRKQGPNMVLGHAARRRGVRHGQVAAVGVWRRQRCGHRGSGYLPTV